MAESIVLKVSLYNEQKTYWTFALDDKLKVGTILDQISDKLSTKNLTLFVRTKSRLGRRSDKKLEPSVSLHDLNEKYRKKKKAYQIYVHSPVVNVNLARVSSDRFSMPITRGTKLWDDLDDDRSSSEDLHSSANVSSTSVSSFFIFYFMSLIYFSFDFTNTPRLSTSHSAPLYLSGVDEKTRTEDGPVIVEQPPKEVAQILFSHNGSLQRTISGQCVLNGKGTFGYDIEKTGSSFFKQGSIYGWSAMTPPTDNSIFGRFDLPRPEERETRRNVSRRRITDVSASTPPTPANSFKPRDVAPIDHSSFFKNKSTDEYSNSANNNTFKPFKQNDTLIIIRVYANNNGELDGPCWTIAVGPNTIAKEICGIIEVHVGVVPNSLRLCLINALSSSGTDEGERKVEDEEKLLQVRAEWLNKGCVPFFFVREKNSCLLVHDLPRRPQSAQEIRGHRRVESEDGIENTAIFLGGSNVEITEPESPEFTPHRRETIDSSSWIMEFNQDLCPLPSVNWIPSSEIERVHKVGDGGYAKVYKSKYKDKFVAVKTLKGVATKDHIESFKKEFEVLSLTNSPYLIKFYGASIDEADPTSPLLSIVVEYCERGTLYKALCNKKLEIDWQTCFKWIHQTLNGMLYLHNMTPQMVHRDIKTLNLLLDSKWNIKVADFGLSRSMSMTNKSSLGVLKGTLAYCAPEIHKGMLFTPKSDAYSVAIVMWELITRCLMGQYHAPYSEYSDIYHDFQIIFLTATQNRRPTIPPKTPPTLRDLLQQCWAGNPDERPTCDEILLQVQSIYVQYQTEKNHWESLRQVV